MPDDDLLNIIRSTEEKYLFGSLAEEGKVEKEFNETMKACMSPDISKEEKRNKMKKLDDMSKGMQKKAEEKRKRIEKDDKKNESK